MATTAITGPAEPQKGMPGGVREFLPDLIAEVTSVCDRGCLGCYAPNVVTRGDGAELLKQQPGLFIDAERLLATLSRLARSGRVRSIGIRGGEPTRHPSISEVLRAAHAHVSEVFLETHGAWIGAEEPLLAQCAEYGTILKLSFDRMHGRRTKELRRNCELLHSVGIKFFVAITEPDADSFRATRDACPWVPDEKVVFQPLASHARTLLSPTVGVINVKGDLVTTLSTVLPE